jgi:hypothetical protein
MPTPANLVFDSNSVMGPYTPNDSPELMSFIDAMKNPALSEADLLPLMPADSNQFNQHDHRTGLTALHYAVYEGRKETLRAMLGRLRRDNPDDKAFQNALLTTDWSRNTRLARELQSFSTAFGLCLDEQNYDLAEVFIQNGLSQNILRTYLRNILINYMHHIIHFCFLCRERSSLRTTTLGYRLGMIENIFTSMGFLTSYLDHYELGEHMPGVKNWLRPMDREYPYRDFPTALPTYYISKYDNPDDLRNDATRAKVAELETKYGDTRFSMQNTLDLAEDFLIYSKEDFERSIHAIDPRQAYSLQRPYPENLPYFDKALAIHRAFKNTMALRQALNSATPSDAVQSCIQGWKDKNTRELGNPQLTEAQLLAIREMSEQARQGGKHELAYTLLTIIMAETRPHLPRDSAIANVVGGFSAVRQAVQRGGSAAASSDRAPAHP